MARSWPSSVVTACSCPAQPPRPTRENPMLTDVDPTVGPTEDDLESSPLRRMVWVFPDRESTRAAPKWQKAFWRAYQEVATELGLTWARHAPEDIAVDCQN